MQNDAISVQGRQSFYVSYHFSHFFSHGTLNYSHSVTLSFPLTFAFRNYSANYLLFLQLTREESLKGSN